MEPVDILEYRPLGLASGFQAVPPDQLCLDGFEERFHYGIVVAISFYAASKAAFDSHVNRIATRDPYDEYSPSVVAVGARPCPQLVPGAMVERLIQCSDRQVAFHASPRRPNSPAGLARC